MPFQDNLRAARKSKGLSQEDLAEKLNVSRQAVSKWEQGVCMPEAKMLLQISEKLEISLDTLMSDARADDVFHTERDNTDNNSVAQSDKNSKRTRSSVRIALILSSCVIFLCFCAAVVLKPYIWQNKSKGQTAVFTTKEDRKSITELSSAFAQAYFAQDVDKIATFLSTRFEGNPKEVSPWKGVDTFLVKGVDSISSEKPDETKTISVEFRNPEYPDSFLYLTVVFVKEETWKIQSYYLEA